MVYASSGFAHPLNEEGSQFVALPNFCHGGEITLEYPEHLTILDSND